MSARRRFLGLPILLLPFALAAQPAPAPESIGQILAPFRELAERLPPELRQHLHEQAELWAGLNPAQQDQLRANLKAWDELPVQDRLRLRERFAAWQQMDAAAQAAALAAMQHFGELDPEQQASWRERFKELPSSTRRGYLFDPASRAAMELADTLFPFIPADQQDRTIALLRELGPPELDLLRRRLARLPPVRRDAYRQRLLELDPAERARELANPAP